MAEHERDPNLLIDMVIAPKTEAEYYRNPAVFPYGQEYAAQRDKVTKLGRLEEPSVTKRFKAATAKGVLDIPFSTSGSIGDVLQDASYWYESAFKSQFETHDATEQEVSEAWRRVIVLNTIILSTPGFDLSGPEVANRLDEHGISRQHPKEFLAMLEAMFVHSGSSQGAKRHRRFQFFDGYFKFAKKTGQLDKVIDLIVANPDVIESMDVITSKGIQWIFKNHPDGEKLFEIWVDKFYQKVFGVDKALPQARLNDIAKAYERGDEHMKKQLTERAEGLADYVIRLMRVRFDYVAAHKVYQLQKKLFALFPEVDKRVQSAFLAMHPEARNGMCIIGSYDESPEEKGTDRVVRQTRQNASRRKYLDALEALTDEEYLTKGLEIVGNAYADEDITYEFSVLMQQAFLSRKSQGGSSDQLEQSPENHRIFIERFKALMAGEAKYGYKLGKETGAMALISSLDRLKQEGQIEELLVLAETAEKFIDRSAAVNVLLELCENEDGELLKKHRGLAIRALREMKQMIGCVHEKEHCLGLVIGLYLHDPTLFEVVGIPPRFPAFLDEEIDPQNTDFRWLVLKSTYTLKSTDTAKVSSACEEACMARFAQGITDPEFEEMIMKYMGRLAELGAFDQILRINGHFLDLIGMPGMPQYVVRALLSNGNVNRENYERALAICAEVPELGIVFAGRLDEVRKKLGVEKWTDMGLEDYVGDVLPNVKNPLLDAANNNVHAAHIYAKLSEVARLRKITLAQYKGSEAEAFGEKDYAIRTKILKDFGFERFKVNRTNDGFIDIVIEAKGNKDLEKIRLQIEFDGDMKVLIHRIDFPAEQEMRGRLAIKSIETALLEELSFVFQNDGMSFVDDLFEGYDADYANKLHEVNTPYKAEGKIDGVNGFEALRQRNEQTIASLQRLYEHERKNDPRMPTQDESTGMISSYLDLIKTARDLDRPVKSWSVPVDMGNPLSKVIKLLGIFSDEESRRILHEDGVEDFEIDKTGIGGETKNNFVGYYEFHCVLPGEGMTKLCFFLDKKGKMLMPGLDEKSPVYKIIWQMALEALAAKVVPEIGPFTDVFLGKQKNVDKGVMRKIGIAGTREEEIQDKKALCCAALVLAAARTGTNLPANKLAILDDVCEVLNLIDLQNNELAAWPTFYLSGKEFVRLKNLFVRHDENNYLRKEAVAKILSPEVLAHIKFFEMDGDQVVGLEELDNDVKKELTEKVRIQTLTGRTYRLPIEFGPVKYRIYEEAGVRYKMVELSGKRKSREKTVVGDDGVTYKLVPLPPHVPIDIAGNVFHATPNQISDDMRAIYEDHSRSELNFEPTPSLYVVLFNNKTGALIAYGYLGPAKKDTDGSYAYPSSLEGSQIHQKGSLLLTKNTDVKEKIGNTPVADLSEVMFEVDVNVGYRQGTFPKLWTYMQAKRGTKDVAIRILTDVLKKKLADPEYKKLVAQLAELESGKTPTDVVIRKPPQKKAAEVSTERPLIKSRPYVIDPEKDRESSKKKKDDSGHRQYEGLDGDDLFILTEDHPFYASVMEVFDDLLPEEVIVLVGSPQGRPARVKKAALSIKGAVKIDPVLARRRLEEELAETGEDD